MNPDGSDAKRVTFSGSYNISPRISADGKTLAYISAATATSSCTCWTWPAARNSACPTAPTTSRQASPQRQIHHVRHPAGGRKSLAVVSVDGRVKQRLTTQAGNIKEPTWGPFMQ
jgi:TolB protein